jgi:ubiquitin C-terminal hydrolase
MKEDIDFPSILNIEDQYVSTSLKIGAFNSVENAKGRQYRLFSVINHKGMAATGGHYVCYTLDSSNNWILSDDEKIRKVHEDVVAGSQAYLLFYELML